MTQVVVYKPWEDDSQHSVYDTANARRVELFEEKIEGLQVKVKRTSEGKFIVKTRVPVPPKPVAKKKAKAPAKKTSKSPAKKTTAAKTKVTATAKAESPTTTSKATTSKKRTTRKTSRKRK